MNPLGPMLGSIFSLKGSSPVKDNLPLSSFMEMDR
jgi:hypothetical protein